MKCLINVITSSYNLCLIYVRRVSLLPVSPSHNFRHLKEVSSLVMRLSQDFSPCRQQGPTDCHSAHLRSKLLSGDTQLLAFLYHPHVKCRESVFLNQTPQRKKMRWDESRPSALQLNLSNVNTQYCAQKSNHSQAHPKLDALLSKLVCEERMKHMGKMLILVCSALLGCIQQHSDKSTMLI